ncbi:hypothetical protein MRX96_044346 [Rhipicephalus microplus]
MENAAMLSDRGASRDLTPVGPVAGAVSGSLFFPTRIFTVFLSWSRGGRMPRRRHPILRRWWDHVTRIKRNPTKPSSVVLLRAYPLLRLRARKHRTPWRLAPFVYRVRAVYMAPMTCRILTTRHHDEGMPGQCIRDLARETRQLSGYVVISI